MNKPPGEPIDLEVAQKDFFSALTVWLILEVFSFALLPGFSLIETQNKQSAWFFVSVPLGIVGAILVGVSSQLVYFSQERLQGRNKKSLMWLGLFGGWLGLAGIGFPLAIAGLEIWWAVQP
ncbi:MAG TPA: hypothetical protein V6D03_14370 [Candidatus Caenarcaniphilales bacterium]